MKYTINGYSQLKLLKNKLDLIDSLILRVLADMYASNSKKMEYKIINSEKYMWVTYGYVLEQIPIIGSERTLIRKISALIEKKILKKEILTIKNNIKGTYLYITFGKNYADLLEYEITEKGVTNCQGKGDKMTSGGVTDCHNKDSSISNSSIIDSKEEREERKDTGAYYQEIKMLLAGYSINYENIARLGKSIERIKDVLKFAKQNGKGEGWIVGAIRDDYKLEVFSKKTNKKEAVKQIKAEYTDYTDEMFEKYLGGTKEGK